MEEIQAAIILDDNYILPGLVMAHSLAQSRGGNKIVLHILKSGDRDIRELFNVFQEDGFRISVIPLAGEDQNFVFDEFFHVSTAALAKFRLPSLLPDLSRILYLDCDLLVLRDLMPLWRQELGDNYGAFVKDIKPVIKNQKNRLEVLGISHHEAYFNSGVMLLNLEAMRKDGLEQKLFAYRRNGINNFMDQDALNVVLGEKAIFLGLENNFLATLPQAFKLEEINRHYNSAFTEADLKEASFRIVHFSSHEKPWNSSAPLYSGLWREQLADLLAKYGPRLGLLDKTWARAGEIIVSLTSYGKRLGTAHQVIESLKAQSLKAKKIILWLAEDEFDSDKTNLPQELTEMEDSLFEIRFCPDLKSYKKLIPALKEFPDSVIVTADDDQRYHRHWLLELFISYLEFPEAIHCHRGHEVSFSYGQVENYSRWNYNHCQEEPSCLLFPTGCGGILYPPHSFTREIFREEMFMKKCGTGDDIWFWAMAMMKKRIFRIIPCSSFQTDPIEGSQEQSLFSSNIENGGNDRMLRQILFYYPFIRKRLYKSYYEGEDSVPGTYHALLMNMKRSSL